MKNSKQIKDEILKLVKDYYKAQESEKEVKGSERKWEKINYAGRVYNEDEMVNLVDSSLEFWLTAGRYSKQFETNLAKFLKVPFCALVNSGSSANLIAFMTLTSDLLGERKINRGDEVITVAAGFPTTVTPIIQYGAVPVFVDVTIPEYNIDVNKLEEALSPKTKAVMIAHTLGNPFNLQYIKEFCEKNNLWLIEDNCDALGSKYIINGEEKYTGTIGDIGTSSFYPPHHITMGEGGAVYTSNPILFKIIKSFRDWGRDCICPPGMDNFCGHRFDKKYGELPLGYDHKYVYSHFGYNLKATDMQASIGVAQLEKLPTFVEKRIEHFNYFYENLKHLEKYLILPTHAENTIPSWFGFMLTVKDGVSRNDLVKFLEEKNIQTRMLFAGNLTKHPCFDNMRKEKKGYRIVGDLKNTDKIMNESFWIGVYPGMTKDMQDYIINCFNEYFTEKK